MRKFLLGLFVLAAIGFCTSVMLLGFEPFVPSPKSLTTATTTPRAYVHRIGVIQEDKVIGNGSGVMIAPLLMLTAAHVANAGPALAIDGVLAPVRVLRVDPKKDLALLMVAVNCPCVSLASHPVHVDQPVTAVGFPYYHILGTQILTEGRVQGTSSTGETIITTPVARGNSGGGVFVRERGSYRLAGIVVGVVRDGMGGSINHLASAMSLEQINTFLETRSPTEMEAVQPQSFE